MYMRSGITLASRDLPPVGASAARASGPGTWFEAVTPAGSLHLYVAGIDTATHAAEAAVVLQRCEALLQGLDDWVGEEVPWRWNTVPALRVASGTETNAWWRPGADADEAASDVYCRIVFSWAWLRGRSAPAGVWTGRLHWPAVPAVLVIARLQIPTDELAWLEPGGAVVLPASLKPGWHGVLRAADEPALAGVPVTLSTALEPRLVKLEAQAADAAATTNEAGGFLCEVRLDVARALPGDHLAGWCDDVPVETGPLATLWCCATTSEPARCLAVGRPMPWGEGWALAIESLAGATGAQQSEKT